MANSDESLYGKQNSESRTRTGRRANLQLIIHALRSHGPTSQRGLCRATGLPPATVNNIVHELKKEGLADIRWINGREAEIVLIAKQGVIASLELSRRMLRAVLFNFDDHTRSEMQFPLSSFGEVTDSTPDAIVDALGALAESVGLTAAQLAGVSLAFPAPIDSASEKLASHAAMHFPRWQGIALAPYYREKLGVPFIVENDANLAALAEWTWGVGRGTDDFLYIIGAEYIGGGLFLGGKMQRGSYGMSGEIGHIVVDPSGPLCVCGNRGCLLTVASERGILHLLQSSGCSQASLLDVIDAASRGDATCRSALYEAGRFLGRALATAATLIDPKVIAIGGNLGTASTALFDGIYASTEVRNLKAISQAPLIAPAQLSDPTILGGAAAILSLIGPGISELPDWMARAAA